MPKAHICLKKIGSGPRKISSINSKAVKTYVNVQQAPNPAAQFPSAVPPFDVHSEAV